MKNVKAKAWLGLVTTFALMGLAVFLPAGTVQYWQAWVYLGVFFTISVLITLYLMKNDPALLERRASGGPAAEKRTVEKLIMSFNSVGFAGVLIVSGFDRRFGWSHVPPYLSMACDVLTIVGFWMILQVFKENTFTSSTIEVAENQRVISTGPYAIVRHPMYAGAAIYMTAMPLALGSYWALLGFAFMLPFIIWRLFDEERFLAQNLRGYAEYCAKVRWRLIPGVF